MGKIRSQRGMGAFPQGNLCVTQGVPVGIWLEEHKSQDCKE